MYNEFDPANNYCKDILFSHVNRNEIDFYELTKLQYLDQIYCVSLAYGLGNVYEIVKLRFTSFNEFYRYIVCKNEINQFFILNFADFSIGGTTYNHNRIYKTEKDALKYIHACAKYLMQKKYSILNNGITEDFNLIKDTVNIKKNGYRYKNHLKDLLSFSLSFIQEFYNLQKNETLVFVKYNKEEKEFEIVKEKLHYIDFVEGIIHFHEEKNGYRIYYMTYNVEENFSKDKKFINDKNNYIYRFNFNRLFLHSRHDSAKEYCDYLNVLIEMGEI